MLAKGAYGNDEGNIRWKHEMRLRRENGEEEAQDRRHAGQGVVLRGMQGGSPPPGRCAKGARPEQAQARQAREGRQPRKEACRHNPKRARAVPVD